MNQYGSALNYAFYVGHNGIRREVMGGAQRRPTPTELDQMRDMVRDGMEMGAVGFSTGLMYEPGMFSGIDEVVELTKEVAPFNGVYDSHTRNPVFEMMASESEAIEVGRRAGVPAKLAHLKAVGLINRGKIGDVIQLVEASNRLGQQVVSDQYPYDGAATANLTDLIILPETGVGAASREAVLQALSDGGIASNSFAAVREASEKGIGGGFSWIKAVGYGSMRIVDAPDDPSLVGKNLFLLSQERGQSPFELVVSLIRENENPVLLTLGAIEEQDVRELLVQPWNMISSDGAYADAIYQEFKHPRSTGSFPRVLGYYVREEKVLTLEEAVRKMTSFPASFLGLSDRGVLSPGFAADITVFDKNRIIDKSTWTDPGAYSEGVVHVIVNGKFVLRNEQVTGQTPGEWVKPNR
ncbi:hypothetical protein ASS64_14455 [Erythrobacter sp. AP23]|nr:hypothetical protein ASS64_14455 [Erythrobacter sp. AP23]